MNRNEYKNTFSKIHPSAVTVERIFDMTEKKQIKFCQKGIIALIVIVSIFLATCICANAATDGALTNGVKTLLSGQTSNTDEKISAEIKLVEKEMYTDENGNKVGKFVFEATGEFDAEEANNFDISESLSSDFDEFDIIIYEIDAVENAE
ncbi:MAG: hypothetical protein J1F24_00940 [Oscillospiraceae bacterium]|nr:hypothetical protein [Oscillospiraceae bacterium]